MKSSSVQLSVPCWVCAYPRGTLIYHSEDAPGAIKCGRCDVFQGWEIRAGGAT